MTKRKDPLAGRRQEINDNPDLEHLLWDSKDGQGNTVLCPVKANDTFELRDCRIRIIRVVRLGRAQNWQWFTPFVRTKRAKKDRIRLLDKKGGYTNDPRAALSAANISPDEHWREVPENLGPPPEPEGVDLDEIQDLAESVAAKLRHDRDRQEVQREFESLPLAERVRRLELNGGSAARRQLRAIKSQVAEGEKRAGLDKAA